MRLLLAVVFLLVLAAGLILAVAFLGHPAEPPPAIADQAGHSTPAAAEQVLARTGTEQDSRSAQAVGPTATTETTESAADPGASIAGVVRVNGSLPSEPISLGLATEGVPSDERRIRIADDGRFEFTGLPDGHRGRLLIPRRYQFIQPESRTRYITVEAPREDLFLDLERMRCLTGRLVSLQDGEPLEDARLSAEITWWMGSQMNAGTELEGNRFFVPFDETEMNAIGKVKLEAWTESGLRGAFEFGRDEIPQDLDLGELALGVGGVARLVVLDPERRPVQGARVRARDVEGIAEETDSQGRATLQGLPPDATFEVLARGFEPIRFPAPISLEPVEVVLQRANRLTIRILDSNGAPQPAARLRISAEGVLFPEGVFNRFLTPQIPGLGSLGGRDGELHYYRLAADERGSIELQSILPGRTFALDVEDEAGGSAHHEVVDPMGAQEQRELTVRLSRQAKSLSGRVQDLFGQPLEGAAVMLWRERDGIGRKTGPDGQFLFEGLHGEEFDLKVELRGYVSSRLRKVRVLPNAAQLQIALEQGRDVRLSVVDARGKRIDAGSAFAFLPDDDQPWFAKPQADGFRLLSDVPALDLELRLQLAGKGFRQALPAHVAELVMHVPELGRVEVTCEPDPGLPRERLGLLLRSTDEGIEQWVDLPPTRTAPTEFEAVVPGSYHLSFSTWEQRGFEAKLVSLRPPIRVQVAPGETTRVQLR
jgi:hypothetical protein